MYSQYVNIFHSQNAFFTKYYIECTETVFDCICQQPVKIILHMLINNVETAIRR